MSDISTSDQKKDIQSKTASTEVKGPMVTRESRKSKKAIISVIILVILLLGGGAYYFFSKGSPTNSANSTANTNQESGANANANNSVVNSNSASSTNSNVSAATTNSDVDDEINQMDKTIDSVNENSDLGDNTLENGQIGL